MKQGHLIYPGIFGPSDLRLRSTRSLLARVLVGICLLARLTVSAVAGPPLPIGQSFNATDRIGHPSDDNPDAQECLDGLCWNPQAFTVMCEAAERQGVDALLRFPSPRPVGIAQNDQVAVEWYAVREEDGSLRTAPAMVVVHESGRGMTVGRMVARGLRDRGIHSFMVQLPFYGDRRPAAISVKDRSFAEVMQQGIADVRRTRDAIAALPGVDRSQISLQGTSLGGFLSATTAGLDSAFHNTFILLAGGDLPKLIETGERETAQVRKLLASQGYTGQRMRQLLNRFEPNRLAHRIGAGRLWLYTATYDTTVPPAHGDSFARASGLAASHHIYMPATHYSGVIFLPMVLDQIAANSGGKPVATAVKSE